MEISYILGLILLLTTTALVRAEFRSSLKYRYIFKPISATLMVLVILISLPDASQFEFAIILLVGMLFCVAGDISLMFESNRAFTVGLALFLIGHIVYTIAMARFNGLGSQNVWITVVLTLMAALVFLYLYPGLGKMKLPVLLYIVAISVMVHTAAMTFMGDYFSQKQALSLTLGATLFYVSDAILAINRFKIPFRYNRVGLFAYFGGQYFIALSVALG